MLAATPSQRINRSRISLRYELPSPHPEKIVDAGLPSLSRIERADALVDFGAQCAQLLDVGEQRPPDLFLILGGQALHFGNGLFECLDHGASIANRAAQNRCGRDRAPVMPGRERQRANPESIIPVLVI